MAEKSSCIRR